MVTPTDALVEFAPGTLVVTITQALDQITDWEDIPVWVSVLMGNRQYIMKLCQEWSEHEEQKKSMEAEVEKMQEQQQEQQDKLSELIDKVNDQVHGWLGRCSKIRQHSRVDPFPGFHNYRDRYQCTVPLSVRDPYPGFPVASKHPLESMVLQI